jgi:uncharacterized paraquat-inducible protein A
MNEMDAVGFCAVVILTLFGVWLFGYFGLLIFLSALFGYMVLRNLYKKYFEKEKSSSNHQSAWQCPYCLRTNSAKVRICTKCGKENENKESVEP